MDQKGDPIIVRVDPKIVLMKKGGSVLIQIPGFQDLAFWYPKKFVRFHEDEEDEYVTIFFLDDWKTNPRLKKNGDFVEQDEVLLKEIFKDHLNAGKKKGMEIRWIRDKLKTLLSDVEFLLHHEEKDDKDDK